MLTEMENTLTIPDGIEEVEYPPEIIARWDREMEVVSAQIATGQAKIYSSVKDLFRDLEEDDA
jgi:hypothetical protein